VVGASDGAAGAPATAGPDQRRWWTRRRPAPRRVTTALPWLPFWERMLIVGGIGGGTVAGIATSDTVVGMVVVVITLQVEIVVRLQSVLAGLSRWQPTMQQVAAAQDEWGPEAEGLINGLVALSASDGLERDLFLPIATNKLASVNRFVADANVGTIRAKTSDVAVLIGAMRQARSHVRAVTSFRDLDWWRSDPGVQLHAVLSRLAARKVRPVKVERIFVTRGDAPDEEELERMTVQASARVSVWWVPLAVAQEKGLDINVTIADTFFAHEDVGTGERASHHIYTFDADEVRHCTRRFDDLQRWARPVEEPVSRR
jgi:hypothetical protein